MSWSTSRRAARYETFSWSSQKAADRRQRKNSTVSERTLKARRKSSLQEKGADKQHQSSKTTSKSSLLPGSTAGSVSKLSRTVRKASRVSSEVIGPEKSLLSEVLSVPTKSTAAREICVESPKFSTISGRRMPAKAKAESKLLVEKHPKKLLKTRGARRRRSSEYASEMLHSDLTLLSKAVSRRSSVASSKRAYKSDLRKNGSISQISNEDTGMVAVAKEKKTYASGVTAEASGPAQHHGILKVYGNNRRYSVEEDEVKSPEADEDQKPVAEGNSNPPSQISEIDEIAAGKKAPAEAPSKAADISVDSVLKRQSRRGSVLPSSLGLLVTKESPASTHKESVGQETTYTTQAQKNAHETTACGGHGDEQGASRKAEDSLECKADEDVFSSAEGTPTGLKTATREPTSKVGPAGTGSVLATEGTVAPKRDSGSSGKSQKSSASKLSEKAAPTDQGGHSKELSPGQEKDSTDHETEPEMKQFLPAAEAGPEHETDSKQDMDEILRELENQTTIIYPESNLVVVLAIVCIVWICVILLLSHTNHSPNWPSPTPTGRTPGMPSTHPPLPGFPFARAYLCSTDSCLRDGEYFTSLFSHDVSPCDNFYQYVCSHWERLMHNPAAGIGVATSIDTMMEDIMHTRVLEYILDSTHNDVNEAKRLYQACMRPHGDESAIELRQLFATWPPAQSWPVDSRVPVTAFDVWSVASRLMREFGLAAILGVQAALDKTYGQPVLELQLPRLLFFRGDDQHSAIVSLFRAAIAESAQLVKSSGMLYELMSDVMAVFKSIARRKPLFPNLDVKLITLDSLDPGLRTFVTVVFEGSLPRNTSVQYSNPMFFEHELSGVFDELGPRAVLNYLGFCLVVSLSPFLPDNANLLKLYSVKATGRVLSPMPKWVLCLRATESVLPVCVVKAHAKLTIASGTDLTSRAWMSQLESMFFRSIRRYSWVDSRTRHVVHFMLRRFRLSRFYPPWSLKADICTGGALPPSSSPLHMFREASRAYQSQRLAQLTQRTRPRDVGDAFGTLARFSKGHQAVYVPFGIVNASVPGNGTAFAFQLARMAARLYAGLTPTLLDDGAADESTLLRFTDRAQRLLDELLDCLARDYRMLPESIRDDAVVDPDEARYVLLAHTAAIALAHAAFKELLNVKRIWNVDFRLAPLPNFTSEQLFFAHFARDNCENSDVAYKAHKYATDQRLPAEQRVNFPLRHLPEFGAAFHCPHDTPMRPHGSALCRIFDSIQKDWSPMW